MARPSKEDLLGLAEVAEVLRTSRRQALRWSKEDDFPKPMARLAATPVWRRYEIEVWAKRRQKR